jgi:integral membrane protein
VRAALLRYRVIAWIVGVFLLVLTVGVIVRYTDWLGVRTDVVSRTVSPIHGFGYLLYVAAAVDLALRRRWRVLRTLAVLLAGTVPFLSFVAERWVTRDVTRAIGAEPGQSAAGPAPGERSPAEGAG